jgi:hypothetical protein
VIVIAVPVPPEAAALPPADGATEAAVDGALLPPDAVGEPDAAPEPAGVADGAGAYVQPGAAPDEHAASATVAVIVRSTIGRRRMSF